MPSPLALPLIVDRAAERRETADATACRALIVTAGAVLAREGAVVVCEPGSAPEAELTFYLGQHDGADLVAVVPADPSLAAWPGGAPPHGAELTPLRALLARFASRGPEATWEHEAATTAVALATWHATHRACAVCGEPTVPRQGGWVRWCARDEREHYPRTDPAVIVVITDADDRLLMAHAALWSPRRFSLLAGYVEPGESLEQAVHREVWEESRLALTDVRYVGSQPWPFPASLMVGFAARATTTEFTLDAKEVTEARWVARSELVSLVEAGELIPAPRGSIARRMIESWHGGPIPDGDDQPRAFG